jgi:hypothetical protein
MPIASRFSSSIKAVDANTTQQAQGITESDDPWTRAMRRGDFETAWQISDSILQRRIADNEVCWHWPRHEQFIWRGQSLAGKRVLVRCYHGLGDTLQFSRFAAPLRRMAKGVIFWVQPVLMPILKYVAGIDSCIALHDGTPQVDYDIDIELMELPHILRMTAATLPGEVPYIALPAAAQSRLPDSGKRRLQVGLVWQSGDWNHQRSLNMEALQYLSTISTVSFHSLQYTQKPDETLAVRQLLNANDLACRDITQMAQHMKELDLIISVDTMAAHLSAALALPTWLLLPREADWRWMHGDRTPWYPTMRLFRQTQPGQWREVIAAVLSALHTLVNDPASVSRHTSHT